MFFFRIGFAVASLLLCVSASAQIADSTQAPINKLSLRDAIEATLARNPQLSSFTFRNEAIAGELQTAALKPARQISAELENVGGSGELKGTQSAELTLALSSVIELGDKREARMGVVTERQRQLATEQEIVGLDLLTEVTRRFIDTAAAQEQVKLQQSTLTLLNDSTQAIKRRVNIGNAPEAELARSQASQVRTAVELRKAESNLQSAKIKLAAMWGDIEPKFSSVNADLMNPGQIYSLKELLAGLEQNPDIQLFSSEARLRDAELRLALSKRKTDIEWSAGVRRLQATQDSALMVGISVPLSSGNRAAGEIATARANQRLTENERDTALLKLRAQLIGLHQEREAALFEVNSLRNEVIPQLRKAINVTRAAFDKGRYGYQELSSAQHELLEAEAALIEAAANAHQLRAEIERLSGSATTSRLSSQIFEVKP
ncbi:MAG TPA: TolC family protein [Marinagarivorans sp.]|nr:TolC family protein [Marinagarivorans sp.]HNG59922.1 TolC family protein [Cellvibrionaceae bacterium]